MRQALQALIAEMEYVLSCINEDKIPFDGDDFHEALRLGKEALAQPEQHQDWCASLTQLLMSMPPKPAPCNCKPPQRTWVDMTDEEILAAPNNLIACIAYVRNKLKEKNNA